MAAPVSRWYLFEENGVYMWEAVAVANRQMAAARVARCPNAWACRQTGRQAGR